MCSKDSDSLVRMCWWLKTTSHVGPIDLRIHLQVLGYFVENENTLVSCTLQFHIYRWKTADLFSVAFC